MKNTKIILVRPETSEGALVHRMLGFAKLDFEIQRNSCASDESLLLFEEGQAKGFSEIEKFVIRAHANFLAKENKRRMM